MFSRHSFLASVPVAAAALSALPAVAQTQDVSRFDRSALEVVLAKPARHRQVFASSALRGGVLLQYMKNALNAYEVDYGEGPGTHHTVAVLYGSAVSIVLDDAAWKKYNVASVVTAQYGDKVDRYPGQHTNIAERNPFAGPNGGSPTGEESITALVKRTANFILCNTALAGFAGATVGSGYRAATASQIHADLLTRLLPGTVVVPYGVAALNDAQEAHFTFYQATM